MPLDQISSPKNAVPDITATTGDKLSDGASQVRSKASDLGRLAVDKIDQNRDSAAGGLESAAHKIHDKPDSLPGGQKVISVAHTAANTLSSTADYIREHDVNSMMADLSRLVKNNPGPALLAAAALGFLVARSFSDD
jgi:hypothetical protein